jgi:prevent-host-death family protein
VSYKDVTMRTVSAKEAKDGFGALLDAAQREPVTITKKGRAVAVLLSREDFERLEALEDAHWGQRARKAAAEGFVGPDESRKLLTDLLDAEG